MTVKELAALTGVSVRTLHYYDQIGLLKPETVDARTGYRHYGTAALARMQAILFYRELDFPLAQIRALLSSPEYDTRAALAAQKQLLCLKKERLERLIAAIERAEKGDADMNFSVFDREEIESYKDEVKRRWGATAAYRESERRATDPQAMAAGLNDIIAAFAAAKADGIPPRAAGDLVCRLQTFITRTQYTCTEEMLCTLGEMYVADERFRRNIDRAGEGTAVYMSDAIAAYGD